MQDKSYLNIITREAVARDFHTMFGMAAMRGGTVVVDDESGEPLLWALSFDTFTQLAKHYANQDFKAAGELIYDKFPAVFGVEAGDEMYQKRKGQ